MATVTVRTAGSPPSGRHPRVTITAPNLTLTLPITRTETAHDRLAADWVETPRPGQRPLLDNAGGQLRRMALTAVFKNYQQGGGPVETQLLVLGRLSAHETPLRVAYGPLEAGLWRLTDISIQATKRRENTNHISLAEVRLGFTEAFQATRKPPSTERPPATTPPPPPASGAGGAPTSRTRTHVVRSGETLSRIALDHCGNANLWPRIAEANKLRNPHRIYPGQKLTIPC